jgi:hypothetical protein
MTTSGSAFNVPVRIHNAIAPGFSTVARSLQVLLVGQVSDLIRIRSET